MSPKFIKTEQVAKSDYKDFKLKAADFYQGIDAAEEKKLWHTMGVTAVHVGDMEQYANVYGRIVAKKNAITYERRKFTEKEALEIGKQAQRFYDWAIKQLP